MPSLSGLASEINLILRQNGVTTTIAAADLIVTENFVWDTSEERLSKAIAEHIWPSIPSDEVFHFTSAETAEAIEQTRKFRLYNVERRHHEHEVEAFCRAHGLDGYLHADESGIALYRREIMPQLFYASFASRFIDEDSARHLRANFGQGGARLRFRIAAQNPDFRRIFYPAMKPHIPLLRALTSLVEGTYKRRFMLRGISRLCAFYLPSEYAIEDEKRMLYKKWEGHGPDVQSDGKWKYLEVPLGADTLTGYRMDLLEVVSDRELRLTDSSLLVRRPW